MNDVRLVHGYSIHCRQDWRKAYRQEIEIINLDLRRRLPYTVWDMEADGDQG